MSKIAFLLLFFSGISFAKWDMSHFVYNCTVVSKGGRHIGTFPGVYCLFSPDGTIYSVSDTGVRAFDKKNATLWEIPGHYHHQFNYNHDKSKLLALSSSTVPLYKEVLRNDKFQVISKDGKLLFETTSDDILKKAMRAQTRFQLTKGSFTDPNVKTELSHFNSFYEIPPLTNSRKLPSYLKAGNFIVNSIRYGIFILSSDLQEVLHQEVFVTSRDHKVHDVKVLADGSYLFFNNLHNESNDNNRYSTVENIDSVTKKVIHRFPESPTSMFYSPVCGGVQVLDEDHWLISHVLTGFYIYSKSLRKIVYSNSYFEINGAFAGYQQVNGIELNEFLKSRQLPTDAW